MAKKILDNRIIPILLHLAGWICFIIYPFIIGVPLREEIFLRYFIHTFFQAGFFYFNIYVLIPKLLTRGKTGFYFINVALIIGFLVGSSMLLHHYFVVDFRAMGENPPFGRPPVLNQEVRRIARPLLTSLFIFAVSTSYRLLYDWFANERRKKELENENLVSELSFLKSQVSPHFLFNTLNNIYSLSLGNSQKTSEAIMKLSQLLRYMLYESDVKQVELEKEIEYLNNYIELQKMRIRGGVDISFRSHGDFSNKRIEPMLLIPFIENAFKHGINYSRRSEIKIDIIAERSTLRLNVMNTVHGINGIKPEDSGIGLSNVRRRLNLLYPRRHVLTIEEKQDSYWVNLDLTLNI